MKNITILGSTGSIGTQALNIINNHKDEFNLIGISANENIELLYLHVNEFKGFLSNNYCNRVNDMKFLFYGNSICPPYPNCLKYIGKQDCEE